MTDEVREKAFAKFAEGKSTNAIATELFNGNWIAAKKARTEWESQGGMSTVAAPAAKKKAAKKKLKKQSAEAADDAEESDAEEWDVPVRVPTARLDEILLSFETSEKANAVGYILQARLDAVLAGG